MPTRATGAEQYLLAAREAHVVGLFAGFTEHGL